MNIMLTKRVVEVIIVILAVSNVLFTYNYFQTNQELRAIKSVQNKMELNGKVIDFTSMFIQKVLQADQEVDFETRLSLENAVRELKDEQIISEWQNFISSRTEADAQTSVKKLLGILVNKIQK